MTKTYASHSDPQYNSKTAAGCEHDGEPVFCLRAQDQTAAAVVRFWALLNPNMADSALGVARRMDDWPTKQVADP